MAATTANARYREVLRILVRHGYGFAVGPRYWPFARASLDAVAVSRPSQLRQALEELGTTFTARLPPLQPRARRGARTGLPLGEPVGLLHVHRLHRQPHQRRQDAHGDRPHRPLTARPADRPLGAGGGRAIRTPRMASAMVSRGN